MLWKQGDWTKCCLSAAELWLNEVNAFRDRWIASLSVSLHKEEIQPLATSDWTPKQSEGFNERAKSKCV
jgi:hypothetical protein